MNSKIMTKENQNLLSEKTVKFNRKFFFLLILLNLSLMLRAQDYMQGKWYTFSKNYVSQVQIFPDSIVAQRLTWEFTEQPNPKPAEVLLMVSTTKANGNVYLCVKTKTDTLNQRMLSILKPIEPGMRFILAVNTLEDRFTDMKKLEDYIKNDKEEKYGFTYYSEKAIAQLRSQKNLDAIQKEDFVKICNDYLAVKSQVEKLYALPNAPKGLRSYQASSMRKVIAENGYNPIVSNEVLDNMFKKFMDDPDLKDLMIKVKG